jgi:hypothetical protein
MADYYPLIAKAVESLDESTEMTRRASCSRGDPISPKIPHRLWLLVLPHIGLLWVPFYNFRGPPLFGFPFFYWYQLACRAATCSRRRDCGHCPA